MKKTIALTILFISFISSIQALSVVTGKWNRAYVKEITLSRVENGELEELARVKLTDKKEFGFAVYPTSGFYVIGAASSGNATPHNRYVFYLKDGDNLSFEVDATSYKLIGANTPENVELEKWHNLVQPLESKVYYERMSNYVDFFPLFEEKLDEIEKLNISKTGNTQFDAQFIDYRKLNILNYALQFYYMPRTAIPQDEDFPDYYNTISLKEATKTDAILYYPYGKSLINLCRINQSSQEKKATGKELSGDALGRLKIDLAEITDPRVKGEVIITTATNQVGTYEGLTKLNEDYGKYLVNESQQVRMRNLMVIKAQNTEGQDAFDFTFRDINGKNVSLSDFKGKVVYVDVWATWCGPCKKEVPAWKALIEEYKNNKDIVFLGVSVDEEKDYDKWAKYVKDGETAGVQIFSGDKKEDIMKAYKIPNIPRFLLFDKKGKIVSTNAPRPTSSEAKLILNATLQKK